MLWMILGTLHYLTGCYQHKTSSAPDLRDWTDLSRETKRIIYCRFGSTAHFISSPLCSAWPESKQHKHFHSSPLRCVKATRGTWGGRNQNGMKEAGGKTLLPLWIRQQWPSWRSLRTESHWREAAVQVGGQASLCSSCPPGGFDGSVSSGHFAVNAEVKICPDSPPSCHDP